MPVSRPLSSFSRVLLRSQQARRPFSVSARTLATENPHDQKSSVENRHKINAEPNEYAKSGSDAETAQQDEAAFNPNITDPHEAKKKAGEGNSVNPLDASPANPEISSTTSEAQGGLAKKQSEGGGGRQGGGDSSGDKYGGSSV